MEYSPTINILVYTHVGGSPKNRGRAFHISWNLGGQQPKINILQIWLFLENIKNIIQIWPSTIYPSDVHLPNTKNNPQISR